MAEKTIVKTIKIETGDAVQSLNNIGTATEQSAQSFKSFKEYKQYVDKLTASLYDLEVGSKDYVSTLKKVKDAQDKMNQVMRDMKGQNNAAEGSYNALTKKMADLKKIWRETADVAQRNEIGKEIYNINSQLKEMDSTIGVFNRNVGDYQNAFVRGFKDLGDGIGLVIPQARVLGDAVEKIFKGIEGGKGLFGTIGGIFKVFSGGTSENTKELEKLTRATRNWQAAEAGAETAVGATTIAIQKKTKASIKSVELSTKVSTKEIENLKLLRKEYNDAISAVSSLLEKGIGSKNLDEYIKKSADLKTTGERYKSAIDISKSTGIAREEIGKYVASVSGASKEMSIFQKIVSSIISPIGVLVTAIVALGTAAAITISKAVKVRKELMELKTTLASGASGAAEQRVQIELLAKKYQELGDSAAAKEKFIKKYADEIKNTGVNIKTVNDADDLFIDNTRKYVKALEVRARAQAAENLIVEKYQESYKKLAELALKKEEAPEERITNQLGQSQLGSYYTIDTRKTKSEIQKEIDEIKKKYQEQIDYIYKYAEDARKESNSILGEHLTITETTETKEKIADPWIELIKFAQGRAPEWNKTLQTIGREMVASWVDGMNEVVVDEKIEDTPLAKMFEDRINFITQQQELEQQALANQGMNNIKKAQKSGDSRGKYLEEVKANLEAAKLLYEEGTEEYQKYADRIKEIDQQIANNASAASDAKTAAILEEVNVWRQSAEQIGSIFGSVADILEEDINRKIENGEITEEEAKKEFETVKKFQIGQVWISTLSGIAGAIASIWSPMNAGMTAIGQGILAAATSASLLASGIAQTMAIQNTKYGSSSVATSSVTPTATSVSYTPDYTTNLTGKTETSNLENAISKSVNSVKVYVLESDIREAGNKVDVRNKEITF